MKIFFFLTNNNGNTISGANLQNTNNQNNLINQDNLVNQNNVNSFENNVKSLEKKKNKLKSSKTSEKSNKNSKKKNTISQKKYKDTKNKKNNHYDESDNESKNESKNDSESDTNKSIDSTKSLDSIDKEIIKLKKQLKEKSIKNKSLEQNNTNDDIENNSENNKDTKNISKANVKTKKIQLDEELLDNIETNQKNKIVNDETKEIDEKKIALIKLFVEAKKNNLKQDENYNNSNFSDNSSNNSLNEKKNNKDNCNSDENMTISFNPKSSNIYIDSDQDDNIKTRDFNNKNILKEYNFKDINKKITNIISSSSENIKKITNSKKNKNLNRSSLSIISNEVTEKECYNDYMIKLSETIKLCDLNINNIQLPKRQDENISNINNQLEIVFGSNNQIIELEPDYYNRNEIINFLNECFDTYSLNIKLYIDELSDKFVFESINNEKFNLLSSPTSILPYLGFVKNTYLNKSKYIAENYLDVGDNIFYLVLENISEKPMFKINMDSDKPIIEKLLELDDDIEIDHLIIKFYKTKNSLIKNDPEYSFFFESEHEIDFEFV